MNCQIGTQNSWDDLLVAFRDSGSRGQGLILTCHDLRQALRCSRFGRCAFRCSAFGIRTFGICNSDAAFFGVRITPKGELLRGVAAVICYLLLVNGALASLFVVCFANR